MMKVSPRLLTVCLSLAFGLVYGDFGDMPSSGSEVYISLMVSSAPTSNTLEVISAVNKTVENINSDPYILPTLSLQYGTMDTQCNRTRAMKLYNREVFDHPNMVAVIGCGCSSATEQVALASNGSIPVVSFDSTSIMLSDRATFPNVFRTVPSDESLPPALATLMNYYGWKQLTIITDREPQFMKLLPLFNDSLSKSSITFTSLTTDNVSTEKDDSSRIFFFNTSPKEALIHLCKASQEMSGYPEYIWITPGWYQSGWWKAKLSQIKCSSQNIERLLNRSLSLLAHPQIGDVNITKPFNFSTYAMDAVKTLAIALNETLTGSAHLNLSLQDVIDSTVFTGASGRVKFNMQGNRDHSIVLLQQYRMDSRDSLSLVVSAKIEDGSFTFVNGETNRSLWPESGTTGIPPTVYALYTLKTSIYIYVIFLVTIGISLSISCLIFNIAFRDRKVIKLTSPKLNYVIILGTVLLMVGNLFDPFPSSDLSVVAVFCMIGRFLISVGYDICFVFALVKTIRVAYIFCSVSPRKKKVRDWQLLLVAAGVILIELIYIIPLLALSYANGDTTLILSKHRKLFTNGNGYTVVTREITCGSTTVTYLTYISLTVSYKLIIHVIGLILAFMTWKVNIDPLNDSRYSAALIYISCVMLAVAVLLIFLVRDNNIFAPVWSTFALLEVCVFLGLTFVPKMVSLYRDPNGENVFGETDNTTSVNKSQLAASLAKNNGATADSKLTEKEKEAEGKE